MRERFRYLRSFDAGHLLLGVLFMLSLVVAFPRVYATDEVQYYAWLRSVWFDQDVDFANEYTTFAQLNPNSGIEKSILMPDRIREKTGLYGNIAPVGSAILWAPWFIATDLVLRLLHALEIGLSIPADGFSWPYQRAISYASALYGFFGLLICYTLSRTWLTAFSARLATLGIWLATPLVYYMTIQMPFAHANGFFVTSAFIYCWIKTLDQPRATRWWMLLGICAGGMFLVREQLILFGILPAYSVVMHVMSALRKHEVTADWPMMKCWLLALLCASIMLTPQIAAYWFVNGEPRPAGEVSGKLNLCSPHAIDTLIDFDTRPEALCGVQNAPVSIQPFSRGAFVWSPILMFATVGLVAFTRRYPNYGVPLLIAFVLQVWINGAFGTTWHLTGAFGFRRLVECSPLFIFGLGYLIMQLEQRMQRNILVVLVCALILWNMGLIVNATVFNADTNLRKGITWPDILYWQLELPQKLWEKGTEIFDRCRYIKNSC